MSAPHTQKGEREYAEWQKLFRCSLLLLVRPNSCTHSIELFKLSNFAPAEVTRLTPGIEGTAGQVRGFRKLTASQHYCWTLLFYPLPLAILKCVCLCVQQTVRCCNVCPHCKCVTYCALVVPHIGYLFKGKEVCYVPSSWHWVVAGTEFFFHPNACLLHTHKGPLHSSSIHTIAFHFQPHSAKLTAAPITEATVNYGPCLAYLSEWSSLVSESISLISR